MADANNEPATPPVEDSVPTGQPTNNGDGSSENKPTVDATEQARRDQQSQKDRAISDKDKQSEDMNYLLAKEAERDRDSYVANVLSDKEKYPNVEANDPMFKYANSKEEVDEIAKELQNRFTDMQQNALKTVRSEPQQLTDEQIVEEQNRLEEDTIKNGRSNFGGFLNTVTRRK